jgi:intergrase/recombinase
MFEVIQHTTMAKATKKAEVKRQPPTPVRIPDDLKIKALKQAAKENRTLSNLILTALKKYLEKAQ